MKRSKMACGRLVADWIINRNAKMITSSLSLGVDEQVQDGMREGAVTKTSLSAKPFATMRRRAVSQDHSIRTVSHLPC